MRTVEGNFKSLFNRLKAINNLGTIPEVFEIAKYPKYEHALGTIYQVNSLLDLADDNTIPTKYRRPLKLASIFLHLGHLPYTYSTERALLLACNLGDRSQDNHHKKYVKKCLDKSLDIVGFEEHKKEIFLKRIFSLKDYSKLYRYFSAEIIISKWDKLKRSFQDLTDDDLKIIIRNIIDSESDGYKYMNLADEADYVQRDALYFGTVRIDISPKHLFGEISKYEPKFSISEKKLIESNLSYLMERFYKNDEIILFSRIYEKILASIIVSKNFQMKWLEEYTDDKLKRLITDSIDENNNKIVLPHIWIKRAKDLFEHKILYSKIFNLRGITFPKEIDVIEIEYLLIGKNESERGILNYPFERGLLLDINYLDEDTYEYPVHPNYRVFSINIFQDDSKKNFVELLKVIENLSHYLSEPHVHDIRIGLANQLSWTKRTRFNNDAIVNTIVDSIVDIETSGDYKKGDFVENFLKVITKIITFNELWHNFENQYIWRSQIDHFLNEHRDKLMESKTYHTFINGLLSLPVHLLQYKSSQKYIDEIYNKLLEKISMSDSADKKGNYFEALWLLNKIRTKNGQFQFFINGMVIIDPERTKQEQDKNEFDVIELIINKNGNAECWIYACSIADDYKQNNRDQLTKLADNIHDVFPDLMVRTRYIIPMNKNDDNWNPQIEDVGRNYN